MGPDEIWPVDAWWRAAFPAVPFSAAQLTADADRDDAANLLEYFGGSRPDLALSRPVYGPLEGVGRGFYIEKAASITDAEMRVFTSDSLTGWTLFPGLPSAGPVTGGRQRLEWTLPGPAAPRILLRGEVRLKP